MLTYSRNSNFMISRTLYILYIVWRMRSASIKLDQQSLELIRGSCASADRGQMPLCPSLYTRSPVPSHPESPVSTSAPLLFSCLFVSDCKSYVCHGITEMFNLCVCRLERRNCVQVLCKLRSKLEAMISSGLAVPEQLFNAG